jgi:hypothetical protein
MGRFSGEWKTRFEKTLELLKTRLGKCIELLLQIKCDITTS